MTTIDTARLRELAEDATPGPWIADPPSAWDSDEDGSYRMQARVRVQDAGSITWDDHGGEVFEPEDATYIAAADPATVLALLDELKRAKSDLAVAEAEVLDLQNDVERLEAFGA